MVSGKSFKSRKAYENHLNSKKYKEMLLKYEAPPPKESFVNSESEEEEEDDMEIEEVDSDEWEDEPIEKTVCFFSGHQSSTVEKNLAYMAEQYSFFLPDPEYISDLDGLMEYLGAKVITWKFAEKLVYYSSCGSVWFDRKFGSLHYYWLMLQIKVKSSKAVLLEILHCATG